jgi:hypothetical protein
VVCHACYDAPCQLKLGSSEGIDRGANPDEVYDALRLRQADPTRLFEDAQTTAAWRDEDSTRCSTSARRARRSTARAACCISCSSSSGPTRWPGTLLPADVDLRLRHREKCPTDRGAPPPRAQAPRVGHALRATGAVRRASTRSSPAGSRRGRSTARRRRCRRRSIGPGGRVGGVPEPGLAEGPPRESLYLRAPVPRAPVLRRRRDGTARRQFYKLVRSRTPPGQPIGGSPPAGPTTIPGSSVPYYRLVPEREAIVAKLHLPYRARRRADGPLARSCFTTRTTR